MSILKGVSFQDQVQVGSRLIWASEAAHRVRGVPAADRV